MTPSELKNEITSGPLAASLAPLWDAGDDTAVAAILNDATLGETLVKPLPMLTFAKFAAGSGIRQKSTGWGPLLAGQRNQLVQARC